MKINELLNKICLNLHTLEDAVTDEEAKVTLAEVTQIELETIRYLYECVVKLSNRLDKLTGKAM